MGTLCLSSPAILRCEALFRIETEVFLIPAGLELICSTSLVLVNRDSKSYYPGLFLLVEGWLYFALALLDLLSHILPAARDSVMVFTVIDTVLASLSFLPILFYTLFLFFLMRADFVGDLPKRFQHIAKITLLIFIPTILALNEVSSFLGISRRTLNINSQTVLAIGFKNNTDQVIWTFFTSFTLALFAAYQAICFCFAFYRVIKVFVDKRNMENSAYDANHLIRGTGWIAAGIKLGAVETVIGFTQAGFSGVMIRRSVRFISRLFLVLGLFKGIDTIEDFHLFRKELQGSKAQRRRGSRLRNLISSPRLSTFNRLTQMPSATKVQTPNVYNVETPNSVSQEEQDEQDQRVTVRYQKDHAPTLFMRFSLLDLPSPTAIQESIQTPSDSAWSGSPPRAYDSLFGPSRSVSVKSVPDSLNAVVEMASQFPSLPPLPKGQVHSLVARGTKPRLPPPLPTIVSSPISMIESDLTPLPSSMALGKMRAPFLESPIDLAPNTPDVQQINSPKSGDSSASMLAQTVTERSYPVRSSSLAFGFVRSQRSALPSSVEWAGSLGPPARLGKRRSARNSRKGPGSRMSITRDYLSARLREQAGGSNAEDWVSHLDISDDESARIENVVTRKAERPKIRNVGSAPRKSTPTPTPIRTKRGSVSIELLASADPKSPDANQQ